jgi:hypothetical protein
LCFTTTVTHPFIKVLLPPFIETTGGHATHSNQPFSRVPL